MSDGEITDVEKGDRNGDKNDNEVCNPSSTVVILQKLIAEVIGTYFVIFCGCGSVAVNKIYGSVTFPGIAVVWGLIVMVMVYSVGHISGAHFNPAVTITFAIFRQFPAKQASFSIHFIFFLPNTKFSRENLCFIFMHGGLLTSTLVPSYILAQLLGSILASGTLCLLLDVNDDAYFGTIPVGSHIRSFVIEIIISFLLMFVISGVATDNRSIGELAGIAVGMTILLNVFVAGPVSGASMNPARSIGPALVMMKFKGIWIYIVGPLIGTIMGGFAYNLIRFTDKPLRELTRSGSFLKSFSRKNPQ
ncbi:hypothetical protein JRO89_XS05G0236000 [Xanthoceras sorbifolium]|uniref:Aquaporin NIP-type n=1 Tax=Xanthoceras sorbifolium TaxID=99658 RepID=A0ABQ8I2X2_9ROSI|nr:hypothetical protein JRO89_XS05G0236000 [Xanthoceras sorbifolium]